MWLRSPPGAERQMSWRDWLIVAPTAWCLPVILGIALLILGAGVDALAMLIGHDDLIAPGLRGLALALTVAPILMIAAIFPAVLLAWGLLRCGWGGYLSFVLAFAGLGALLAWAGNLGQSQISVSILLIALMAASIGFAFRLMLFVFKGEIFTNH